MQIKRNIDADIELDEDGNYRAIFRTVSTSREKEIKWITESSDFEDDFTKAHEAPFDSVIYHDEYGYGQYEVLVGYAQAFQTEFNADFN